MKKRQLASVVVLFLLLAAVAAVFLYNRPVLRQSKMNYTKYSMEYNPDQEGYLIGLTDQYQYQYYFKAKQDEFGYYYLSDGISEEIYSSKASAIVYDKAYNGALIICEVLAAEEMKFTVKKIDSKTEELLYEDVCYGLPIVRIVGDAIIISYGKYISGTVVQPLIVLDLIDNSQRLIAEYEYQMDEDGLCTGDLLEASDGFDDGVVFEVIRFDHESMNLDETGRTELFYYDFESEAIQKLPIESERKLLYVCGDRTCIITSDYASARPLEDVGALYLLKNGDYRKVQIPDIGSANDIIQGYRISDDMIAVQTKRDLYFINVKNCKYERIQNVFNVSRFGKTIAYTKRDGGIEFCTFQGEAQ